MEKINNEILVCAAGEAWLDKVVCQLNHSGIVAAPCAAPEELWEVPQKCLGILISLEEIISIQHWFQVETIFEKNNHSTISSIPIFDSQPKEAARIKKPDIPEMLLKRLCQIQTAPVFVIIPERDDLTEYTCLCTGVTECISAGQLVALAVERIRRHLVYYVEEHDMVLRWEHVILEQETGRFRVREQTGYLSAMECRAFAVLLQAKGAVVSRQTLAEQLWGESGKSRHRNLDAVIRSLRSRIRGADIEIGTRYGKGYYLKKI